MDKDTKDLMDFTVEYLDVAEDEVIERFEDTLNIEEAMYMWMADIISFRLLSYGNWNKDDFKRWMGDRVEGCSGTYLRV
jgi:hypothetical protein